jgi:hypothetical protein
VRRQKLQTVHQIEYVSNRCTNGSVKRPTRGYTVRAKPCERIPAKSARAAATSLAADGARFFGFKLGRSPITKEAAAETAASLNSVPDQSLEFLDQADIDKPSYVIIEATRIADGVAKLESKRLRRVRTEYVIHTHGEGAVI